MNNGLIALFIGLALALFAWPLPSSSAPMQVRIIPGSSVSGARIFRDKECAGCHSSDRLAESGNPAALAAGLWNHSPEMWLAQRGRNVQPVLSSTEVSDLFAYFFSLAYANTPGDAARGRAVFDAKTCSRCHDTEAGQRRPGPPISTWSEVDDPLSWAERMWNHSRTVAAEVSGDLNSQRRRWWTCSLTCAASHVLRLRPYFNPAIPNWDALRSKMPANPV